MLQETGDLVFEVAETYQEVGQGQIAQELCELLLSTEKYNIAGVWLLYAQTLRSKTERRNDCIQVRFVARSRSSVEGEAEHDVLSSVALFIVGVAS